ncbi:MAG: lipoyl(octanoyl) transferase LipB [Acidobacteria bacterium]|nr:lipoyl(octanoyl) transferase LipB [Acidobacteriota bacterium]
MIFVDLGLVDFGEALRRQEATVQAIYQQHQPETVYLAEHPHVFTVGRSGNEKNLLASHDFEGRPLALVRLLRGGDVTYHGPGQLVGYPHLDLQRRRCDVHKYLRQLEEVLILAAARFGVDSYRRPGLTGVWTDRGKLASIGVGIRRWISMHGVALNVNTDLRYFRLIHPCGLPDCPVTSLRELTNSPIDLQEAKSAFQESFLHVFAEDRLHLPSTVSSSS